MEPLLQPAPLDSARFGIQVARARHAADGDADALIQQIRQSSADLIILRTDAGDSRLVTALQQQGEFVIHADTLVYHGMSLHEGAGCASPDVRCATATDSAVIAAIAAASFQGYRSHYSANPLLSQDLVHKGYIEWSQSRLDESNDLSSTWVVCDGERVAGFATCDQLGSTVDIVLNAVDPTFERRGHYGRLLNHLIHHYSARSFDRLIVSTQIWNYGVQRQWAKAGLRLHAAMDTYHLDRRLKRQAGPAAS
ncbi:GNAT family N-acetyltransferase [Stenotrophomonas sp.]|uniref:GNAT family N-acetyltransferase n=1 Tax=Stenotrophomonas sp. TaxID=69392 RepID=UPI002D7564F7|nr:GNAT family N-acetyltransferase [Stenotrophomonas sp.]HYQ23613.1 GNAT family N-acetyltransferase [Stenotrophomonas sp.]